MRLANANELIDRARGIRLLVLDVDGVLTDGGIRMDEQGREIKNFSVRDGFGIACWRRAGHRLAVLSGRASPAVSRRCRELGFDRVIQGRSDKAPAFLELMRAFGVSANEVSFMGDDLPDVPLLLHVGLAAAPADAVDEARAAAHWISPQPGGRHAVRALIEMILDAQGRWREVLEHYHRPIAEPAPYAPGRTPSRA